MNAIQHQTIISHAKAMITKINTNPNYPHEGYLHGQKRAIVNLVLRCTGTDLTEWAWTEEEREDWT